MSLTNFTVSQDPPGCLYQQPAQPSVARLGDVPLVLPLARAPLARNQPKIALQLVRLAKAPRLIDHRHEGRRPHRSDQRGRLQKPHPSVVLGNPLDPALESGDLLVQARPQRRVRVEPLTHVLRQTHRSHASEEAFRAAAGYRVPLTPQHRPHHADPPRPRSYQRVPDPQLLDHAALRIAATMSRPVNARAVGLEQRLRITVVGLHPSRPLGVHRCVVRVGDHHRMAQALQVARHPLRLRRRLDQHSAVLPAP